MKPVRTNTNQRRLTAPYDLRNIPIVLPPTEQHQRSLDVSQTRDGRKYRSRKIAQQAVVTAPPRQVKLCGECVTLVAGCLKLMVLETASARQHQCFQVALTTLVTGLVSDVVLCDP